MKISLIIPCYNEESNLQKGVLDKIGRYAQNDSRFIEVLVVDDGSTDRSKNIVKKFYLPGYSKFKLIENPHRGKAFAVITGIKEAKGKYIIFSDIDLAKTYGGVIDHGTWFIYWFRKYKRYSMWI